MAEDNRGEKRMNEERIILLITKLLMEEGLITADEENEMFRLVKSNDQ